jgi:hypothetical protein
MELQILLRPRGNHRATVYRSDRDGGIVDYPVNDFFGHVRIDGSRVARNLREFPRELIRARQL